MWFADEFLVWFLLGVTAVGAALLVLDLVLQALRRRARYQRYEELNTESQHLTTRPVALGGIAQERGESIRLDAENAARLAALRPGYQPANPYSDGTAEGILWFATYNLLVAQLQDTVDINLSEPVDKPVAGTAFTVADLHFWDYASTQPET